MCAQRRFKSVLKLMTDLNLLCTHMPTCIIQLFGHFIATLYAIIILSLSCKANGDKNQLGAWLDSEQKRINTVC